MVLIAGFLCFLIDLRHLTIIQESRFQCLMVLQSYIISWFHQHLPSRILNEFMDLARTTDPGRIFHGSDPLRGKAMFLTFIFALWVIHFRV